MQLRISIFFTKYRVIIFISDIFVSNLLAFTSSERALRERKVGQIE